MTLERILVVRLADIGDVLTATPALRALRGRYPAAVLHLVTTPAAAKVVRPGLVDRIVIAPRNLANHPAELPAVLALLRDLRAQRYDAVLFLHHLSSTAGVLKYRLLAATTGAPVLAGLDNGRGGWLNRRVPDAGFGAQHEVSYALAVAALLDARLAATDPAALVAPYTPADAREAAGLLAPLGSRPRVALHSGSGGYALARRWDTAKWAALADALVQQQGAAIVLVGTPADGADAVQAAMTQPALNLAGRTSLPVLAALLAQCDLFLGADSGIMHLAAASGTPLVALFGPSNPAAWGPWTPTSPAAVVRLGLRCSPCSYVGQGVGLRAGCWHRSCMADLEPAQVLAALEELPWLERSERS